ncbi:histone-lysine N-methyltransferase, H3 lysine-79 specific [Daphnia magna]|uniref:histone-lysine N-methyltransferase, H3 lysine-79 specific n=1 Tax=Daphnia magna TaxID=35525 RepID=UPI001E1BDA3D|nr:histone-lysine N-methyltransferase, H3 lysine-79 specific [Daphnia magna]
MIVVSVQWLTACRPVSAHHTRTTLKTANTANSLIIASLLFLFSFSSTMCSSQPSSASSGDVRHVSSSVNLSSVSTHRRSQVPVLFSHRSSPTLAANETNWKRTGGRAQSHCPSCRLPATIQQKEEDQLEGERAADAKTVVSLAQQQSMAGDLARLESIKRQILIKLGLNSKPNLSSSVIPPRDFILETLLRAEESSVVTRAPHRPSSSSSTSNNNRQRHHLHHSQADAASVDNVIVDDDFYGKTSEIIAFGEPGPRLNGQVLAEFSRVQETAPEPSLRVKSATLWLHVQMNGTSLTSSSSHMPKSANQRHQPGHQQQRTSRSPTLYVFRLLPSDVRGSLANATNKDWNELLLASQKVTIQHSGWMKINITEGVQQWFSTSSPSSVNSNNNNNKLRLLIDCSGCGSTVQPVLFTQRPSVAPVRPEDNTRQQETVNNNNNSNNSNKKKKKKKKRKKRRRRLVLDKEEEEKEEEEREEEEEGRIRQQLEDEGKKAEQLRPFIVIHTDSSSSRRLRRRTPLDCGPTTSACCKQRFFVSFRALGWDDWIIAPSGYYANYCRGDCGSGAAGRAPESFLSYHSHVLDQVRKQLPALAISPSKTKKKKKMQASEQQRQQRLFANYLQPCCAPTKFSSMSLIYFGPDMNIIKRDLPKMVVDECGCP